MRSTVVVVSGVLIVAGLLSAAWPLFLIFDARFFHESGIYFTRAGLNVPIWSFILGVVGLLVGIGMAIRLTLRNRTPS